MISEEELQLIRDEQEKYQPTLVTTRRRKLLEGEGTEATRHLVDVHCRITPGQGSFREVASRFVGITPYLVTFAVGTDVQAGDQIVTEDATIFEVRDVREPKSYHTALQVLADGLG